MSEVFHYLPKEVKREKHNKGYGADLIMKKDTRATLNLPTELHKELAHYAIDVDLTLSQVIERIWEAFKKGGDIGKNSPGSDDKPTRGPAGNDGGGGNAGARGPHKALAVASKALEHAEGLVDSSEKDKERRKKTGKKAG